MIKQANAIGLGLIIAPQHTQQKATTPAIIPVHDHRHEMASRVVRGPRLLEDTEAIADQIAKILGLEIMGNGRMARQGPAIMWTKWMWTLKKMPTRTRWKR